MRHSKYFLSILPAGLFFLATAGYALPFSIVPNGSFPTVIRPGTTASASYTITNITNFNPPSNLVKWLPPNVAVNLTGTTCTPTSAFHLAPNQSCILNLTVSGVVSNTDPDPHHHLFVCMSDLATCAGPTPVNSLNVTVQSIYTTVGSYSTNGSNGFPLGYTTTDGGKTWTVSTTLPSTQGYDYAYLSAVACDSGGQLCAAIGNYFIDDFADYYPISYTSADGGKTWTVSTTQPPPHETQNSINGMACSNSGQQCAAVGSYYNGSKNVPLTYTSTDGGKNWALSGTLPPPISSGSVTDELNSVACSSSGLQCVTIGHYDDSPNTASVSYTSTDGGNTWTLATTLPPVPVGGTNTLLNGVACDATGLLCTAVGYYTNVSNQTVPLSYTTTDGGNNWVMSTIMPPAQGSSTNELNAVTCSSTGLLCTTVGSYMNVNGGPELPLSYTSTNGGNTWTVSTTLPPSQGSGNNQLYGVTCDSSGQLCIAVGFYNIGSHSLPLSYTSSDGGKNWVVSTTLPPAIGISSYVGSVA